MVIVEWLIYLYFFCVKRLIAMIAIVARANEATLTVIKSFKIFVFAQIIVLIAPVSIPAMTPYFVVFFHFNENRMAGPNEAPNPLQA